MTNTSNQRSQINTYSSVKMVEPGRSNQINPSNPTYQSVQETINAYQSLRNEVAVLQPPQQKISQAIKLKHNNKSLNDEIVDHDQLVESLVNKKASLLHRIRQQQERLKDPPKSLVEEFASYDPYFLKLLKIKIFSETYTPHQNSIFYDIKSVATRKNNKGIYYNKVRSSSCADNSFLLLNTYKESTIRESRRRSRFMGSSKGSLVCTPNPSTPATSNNRVPTGAAMKNVKRKLNSSRRSQRPVTVNRTRKIDDDSSSFLMYSNNLTQRQSAQGNHSTYL